jgi:hypothetical protein
VFGCPEGLQDEEERTLDDEAKRDEGGECWIDPCEEIAADVVGVFLVAAGKGSAGVIILVAPTNLHYRQSVTGVAGELGCWIHGGIYFRRRIAEMQCQRAGTKDERTYDLE